MVDSYRANRISLVAWEERVMSSRPVILIDDREKRPFTAGTFDPHFTTQRAHLETGDYTFEDYQEQVCIEKKSGWQELSVDWTKRVRPTFLKFLARMTEFEYAYVIIITSWGQYRQNPTKYVYEPRVLSKIVNTIMVEYGIPIIFIDRYYEKFLREFFLALYKEVSSGKKEESERTDLFKRYRRKLR